MRKLIARILPVADRSAAGQALWLGAIMAGKTVSGIVQTALTARILGPEGFGVLAAIMAVPLLLFGFMAIHGDETITTFVTRSFSAGRREEAVATLRLAFASALGLSVVSYVLLTVAASTAGELLRIERAYRSTMLLYGVTGMFMATRLASIAVLRLTDRLRLGFAITVGSAVVRITVITVAWLTDGGLLMVVIAYVGGAGVEGVGLFIAAVISARRAGLSGWWKSLSVRVPRDVVRFQVMTFLQTKAGALSGTIDVVMMNVLTSATQVGLYRAARQIIDTTRLPVQPIGQGMQVEYSRRYYTFGGAALGALSRRFTLLSVALAVTTYGLLALFHTPIIRVMLGPGFAEVAQPLMTLIPGSFVFMSIAALSPLPAATGRAEASLIANWAGIVAMALSLVLLAPAHGATGAAWANTVYFVANAAARMPFVLSTLRRSRNRGGS